MKLKENNKTHTLQFTFLQFLLLILNEKKCENQSQKVREGEEYFSYLKEIKMGIGKTGIQEGPPLILFHNRAAVLSLSYRYCVVVITKL